MMPLLYKIIPLLYKLYARLLYNRLEPLLDQHQTPDQAGFRHNYCTVDHLYTTTILQAQSYEWQLGLWLSTVDFKKAFDTINHDKLWTTLARQGIPTAYTQQLQTLYQDQVATVMTDRQSKPFSIQRGVKQGDPLSSLLFNATLEDMFKQLKHTWSTKNYGIKIDHTSTERITTLRFADDVLLIAPMLPQVTCMLTDLKQEARKYGLQIHPDKPKS